jgi:hypothetical protein
MDRLCDALYSRWKNSYYDRQAYSAFMLRFLTEDTATEQSITVTTPPRRINIIANMQTAI